MTEEFQFEMLLDSVLHDAANPEPAAGLEQRIDQRVTALTLNASASPVANVLVMAGEISSESVFVSLWRGARDALFPRRLPPLVLQSRAIPVDDPLAADRGTASTVYAVAVHAMAVLVIGFVVRAQVREVQPVQRASAVLIEPVLHVTAKTADRSGGGGGQRGETPVSKGSLPRMAEQQIVAPSRPPLIQPRVAMEPTVVMQPMRLADNIMPNVGMSNSPLAGISMGDGRGTGIGPGDGPGVGPGTGGNIGNGLRHVGGLVSEPRVIYMVEPEFTEEARKAKISGNVLVYLWVDEQGRPSHIRVARGMGFGLDQRALDAVAQYRFKPAMENGKPVTVEMYVDVNFNIY